MKPSAQLKKAEKYRRQMNECLVGVNKTLSSLLKDENASVFYQNGDGWCVLFNDDHNAPIQESELDILMAMNKVDAFDFLMARSI